MQIFRTLMLGLFIAAALPACSKHDAESPGNPPTGVATKTTPDTGGTGTAPAPADSPAATPGTSTPPSGQQPGR